MLSNKIFFTYYPVKQYIKIYFILCQYIYKEVKLMDLPLPFSSSYATMTESILIV